MNWKDDKDLGPWEFSKQKDKFGYANNPRFTDAPASEVIHHPCGYWFSDPAQSKGYFFGEDNVGNKGENIATIHPIPGWPNSEAARNAFIGSLKNYGEESFEEFEEGGGSAPRPLSFGGYANAVLDGGYVVDMTVQPPWVGGTVAGRHPTHGDKYLEAGQDWVLTFSEPMYAFGMYMTDIGDFGAEIDLVMTYVDGTVESIPLPLHYKIFDDVTNAGGWISFIGVFDTTKPFASVTMDMKQAGGDIFGFDQVLIARQGDIQLERPIEQLIWPASEVALIPFSQVLQYETESANYRIIASASDWKHPDGAFNQVRGYFNRSTTNYRDEKISGVSIGLRDGSTLNFAEPPTRLSFDGSNGYLFLAGLPNNEEVRFTDWTNFTIDKTKDYLIHIFVEFTGDELIKPQASYAPWILISWRKASGVDETMVQNVSGYSEQITSYYLQELQVRDSSLYQY